MVSIFAPVAGILGKDLIFDMIFSRFGWFIIPSSAIAADNCQPCDHIKVNDMILETQG